MVLSVSINVVGAVGLRVMSYIFNIMLKRICLFTVGLFVMSVGVAFSIVSTLGTTPISSISYSLTLITNINIGITTFVFNAALILIQFLILRSKFKKNRLLQLINCVLFGYFTDLALYLVSFVPFDNTILFSVLFLFHLTIPFCFQYCF